MGADLFVGAQQAPAGIILMEPDGAHRIVAHGVGFPNGIVITDDDASRFVAKSFGTRLEAFDNAADGNLNNGQVYAELDDLIPDGMCLDRDGNIWVGGAIGGKFVRAALTGDIITRIDINSDAAISRLFGAADGRTLYCLCYARGLEIISSRVLGTRVETARVDVPGADSP
ncbi:MAG: SMP-30/gluconolactonase/LRE family protein [Gammaproteobacteria bacterium]